MRWTRPLSVDARSLLCDSYQILAAFIDFTRTYCCPIMVNLKNASMYDGIDRMGEHNIVAGEVVMSGRGCKCFGFARHKITLFYINFKAVLPVYLGGYDIFQFVPDFALHFVSSDSSCYGPNKAILLLRYQRLSFPSLSRLLTTTTT